MILYSNISRSYRIYSLMHISKTIGVFLALFAFLSACTQEQASAPPKKTKSVHLVETIIATKDMLSHVSEHSGTLKASRTIRIFNQEEGRIRKLPFYEADKVVKNDILVELDDKLLHAQLNKSVATRRQAKQDLQRLISMEKRQLVSKEERMRAETVLEVALSEEQVLKTRLSYTRIKAPFDGIISERLIETGDIAPRFTHLLSIYDPDSLITEISVSELLLPYISPGDKVEVRIDALADRVFNGKIRRIHPMLDERTRRGKIEVVITPVPEGAMIGQYSRVYLNTQAKTRLVIPFRSLQRDRKGEFVYRVNEENVVKRVAVRSGLRLADKIEILEGLDEGSKVVVRGFLGLGDGKTVKDVATPDLEKERAPDQ